MASELELVKAALSDRYRVHRELGRGGMATVYLADDLKHHRQVAVKVLAAGLGIGAERFMREIGVTARLDHPHILPLLDSGQSAGMLFYVMPYVEGESLRDRLHREKQLPVEDAVRIAREVADALDLAHRLGIIHRDIKPENILLSAGHARVADFGIARAVSVAGTSLTETGMAIGTPAYMSPEQATAEQDLDNRTDIYSLACVVYEMIAGQAPYTGATPQAILARKLTEQAPSLRVVRPVASGAVEQAILKALAKVPADRFRTTTEFANALESGATQPVRAGAKPGRWALGALAVLVVAGVLGWWFFTRAPAERSIAVLPFTNISGSAEQDYFSDGLSQDVLTSVAGVGRLRVISRNSVLPYKATTRPLKEIARELGVRYVVVGNVRREENRVRVAVQLVDARADRILWAGEYEREMAGIFGIQAEIAQRVAHELGATLTPDEQRRFARVTMHDPAAYDLVLRSREYAYRFRKEDHEIAIGLARAAIERDPTFAEGLANLSMLYANYVSHYGARASFLDSAVVEAEHAIALDSLSANAHGALGTALIIRGQFDSARVRLERAAELDPSNGTYSLNLGVVHCERGAIAECIYWLRRTETVDPARTHLVEYNLAVAYRQLGMLREAADALEKARRLRPDWWEVQWQTVARALVTGDKAYALAQAESLTARQPTNGRAWLAAGEAYMETGDLQRATAALERAYALAPTTSSSFAYAPVRLAQALLQQGKGERAESLLAKFDAFADAELSARNRSTDLQLSRALVAALRGQRQVALERLEDAFRGGWTESALISREHAFDFIRQDSEFESILSRVDARARDMRRQVEGAKSLFGLTWR